MEPKFMTTAEVVAQYQYRPQKSAEQYAAEIAQLAQYYGAGIWQEKTEDCFFDKSALEKRLNELEVTEDAEVVSIETATAPGCVSGGQPMLPR
jgi:hypothetical protein